MIGQAAARSIVVDFEDVDIPGSFVRLPRPDYEGFHWKYFYADDSTFATPGSGYQTGVTSGTQTAFSASGVPAFISIHRGTFTLDGVNMTAAWDSRLTVEIHGFRHGVELYHDTVHINDLGPTHVVLDYQGIDKVEFFAIGGRDDPKLDGVGEHIVFDDFEFSHIKGAAAFAPDQGEMTVSGPHLPQVHADLLPHGSHAIA